MKDIKVYLTRIFLLLSIVSVLLTVKVPLGKMAIGQILVKSYSGMYSVIAFIICLAIFFVLVKQIKEDLWVNRLKLLMSCSFLVSLITNIIFL